MRIALKNFISASVHPVAQFPFVARNNVAYTTPGTYTFTVPPDVYSISAVAIGPGGDGENLATPGTGLGGGAGGGLCYLNDIQVTPGQQISIVVGAHGTASQVGNWLTAYAGANGISTNSGSYTGQNVPGGGWSGVAGAVGFTGGRGGCGYWIGIGAYSGGGGGAAGYLGDGGDGGGPGQGLAGSDGDGGAGGGGASTTVAANSYGDQESSGCGGGVGIFGVNGSGVGGFPWDGLVGLGGSDGSSAILYRDPSPRGGNYGGGGNNAFPGASGAVNIVYGYENGLLPSFPYLNPSVTPSGLVFSAPMESTNLTTDISVFAAPVAESRNVLTNTTFQATGNACLQLYNDGVAGEITGFVRYASSSQFDIGTEDFQVDTRFNYDYHKFVIFELNGFMVYNDTGADTGLKVQWYDTNGILQTTTTSVICYVREWNDLSFAKRGTVLRIYKKGTLIFSASSFNADLSFNKTGLTIGRNGGYALSTGWATTLLIDNFKIIRGEVPARNGNFITAEPIHQLAYKLDFVCPNNSSLNSKVSLYRDILELTGTGSTVPAVAYYRQIPNDGNWYYYEAEILSGNTNYKNIIMGGQTSANAASGQITAAASVLASTYRGVAVRYYPTTAKWYYVTVSQAGAIGSATQIPTANIYSDIVWPGISLSSGAAIGDKIRLNLYTKQQMYAPNIAASNASAVYQAPCYPVMRYEEY